MSQIKNCQIFIGHDFEQVEHKNFHCILTIFKALKLLNQNSQVQTEAIKN